MRKRKLILSVIMSVAFVLSACGAEKNEDTTSLFEQVGTETSSEKESSGQQTGQEETGNSSNKEVSEQPVGPGETKEDESPAISEEQALAAVQNYCETTNPNFDAEGNAEGYTEYWDVSTNENGEIVVLYRSYTAAEIRYYVNPASGEVYVTELVPGIIDEEQKTDETFNIRDYLNKSSESQETVTENGSTATRKDGERFEDVIMLEGMEETVQYEHACNDAMGIEIDFEYDSLVRQSGSDKEFFISIYDDINDPENYLEFTYIPENIDAVTASISEELSKDYEIYTDTYELENAGNCTRIDGSASVEGTKMPQQLQKVYIVPAGEGTVVGRAHYGIEAAEGFGHRFAYMMDTLIIH